LLRVDIPSCTVSACSIVDVFTTVDHLSIADIRNERVSVFVHFVVSTSIGSGQHRLVIFSFLIL